MDRIAEVKTKELNSSYYARCASPDGCKKSRQAPHRCPSSKPVFVAGVEACIKRRAVTVTGFAVHGAPKSQSARQGLEISRALIHFRSLTPANDFLDYAYQDSRSGGPTNFRKGVPAPDFFRVTPPMIGGSKPGPLASFL